MKRFKLAKLSAVTLSITLSACGGGGGSPTTAPATAPVATAPPVALTNYALVGSMAHATILSEQPVSPNPLAVNYLFESGVPQGNRDLIKAGVDNFVSRFSGTLNYSSKPIGVMGFSTLAGGQALAKSYDPNNAAFLTDMTATFARQPDPAAVACQNMGGFSVGYERLLVISAPCYTNDANQAAISTHELTHEVQSSVLNGQNAREVAPVWMVEGQPQVVGAATSVRNGADSYVWSRADWILRVPKNRSIADLALMEGETNASSNPDIRLSEYTVGGAMMEYLIARSGLKKSLDVLRQAKSLANGTRAVGPQLMVNFRSAFQTIYGQSLDAFYAEVLPYINYLPSHSPTGSDTSSEPGAKIFLTEGCHSYFETGAALQQQVNGSWVDLAAVKGWDYAPQPTCPAGTLRPWTIAEVAKGTALRWHVYQRAGDAGWYSTQYVY
jgi:hypothetical protein